MPTQDFSAISKGSTIKRGGLMRLTGKIAIMGTALLLAEAAQAQTNTTKPQVTTKSSLGNTTTYTTTTSRGATITTKVEDHPSVGTRTITTTYEPPRKSGYDTSGGYKR
jgi:hypothetical protein